MPGSESSGSVLPASGSRRACILLIVIWGVLHVIAQPGIDLWWAAVVSPLPLAWMAITAGTTRRALGTAGLGSILFWLWSHRWLADITLPGLPALAVYMAGWTMLLAWAIRRLVCTSGLPATLALPMAWVGIEFARGALVMGGFPWFQQGHPLIAWPAFVQIADVVGAQGVSALAVLGAGAMVDGLRWHQGLTSRRTAMIAASTAVLIIVANLGYGAMRLRDRPASTTSVAILLMQTNLPQDNKQAWTIEAKIEDVAGWMMETRAAVDAATTPIDLIAWPETMLGVHGMEPDTIALLRTWQPNEAALAEGMLAYQRSLDIPMLVGSPAYDGLRVEDQRWQSDRQFNSAYLIDGAAPLQRYDKYFLTPFGEVMPIISRSDWLEKQLAALGAHGMTFDLDAADTPRRLMLTLSDGSTINIGTPICFEATMPGVCRRLVYEDGRKSASVLINLSNDAWFFDSVEGRMLHERMARFRAIENRVPLVRAANTGLSVGVDSTGKLIDAGGDGRYPPALTAGTAVVELPLDDRRTVYGRIGDLAGWIALLLLIPALIPVFRAGRGTRSDDSRDRMNEHEA